jgi:transcriptional regulator with XRE-family HTH domain
MGMQHPTSCGRTIAVQLQLHGTPHHEVVSAISQHCNVSVLRAHRIAHGYTLVAVADLLKKILQDSGEPSEGLAHQMVSRWENGVDIPSRRYLDALCELYRTRPDRLGFGRDYSKGGGDDGTGPPHPGTPAKPSGYPSSPGYSGQLILPQDLYGTSTLQTVELLEQRVDQSGYQLYTSAPAEFIPARMIDLAHVQALLLRGQSSGVQRRLHRIAAKHAGFIGIRLTDVASAQETFSWFSMARQSARQAQDPGIEAWIAGHTSDGYSCYWQSLAQGLNVAKLAQAVNGSRPNSAMLFGYLAEAGIQARMSRRRETIEAVRQAQRTFDALPQQQIAADGVRIPEYFLRWHQSNALSIIGEARLANPLRRQALELPLGKGDLIGRALLGLDEASLMFGAGEPDEGSRLIKNVWDALPAGLHDGQVSSRTKSIIDNLAFSHQVTGEISSLREYLNSVQASSK